MNKAEARDNYLLGVVHAMHVEYEKGYFICGSELEHNSFCKKVDIELLFYCKKNKNLFRKHENILINHSHVVLDDEVYRFVEREIEQEIYIIQYISFLILEHLLDCGYYRPRYGKDGLPSPNKKSFTRLKKEYKRIEHIVANDLDKLITLSIMDIGVSIGNLTRRDLKKRREGYIRVLMLKNAQKNA